MSSNEYMRKYMSARYHKRKEEAIRFLGGECSNCGSNNDLDFDHKNRKTKGFTIAKSWSINKERFWEEVKKCQLLCGKCHNEKTQKELGKQIAIGKHGTISTYRYCRCDLCKKAKSDWTKKKYRERNMTRIFLLKDKR